MKTNHVTIRGLIVNTPRTYNNTIYMCVVPNNEKRTFVPVYYEGTTTTIPDKGTRITLEGKISHKGTNLIVKAKSIWW